MAVLPHDVTDLYLAPTVLALQARVDELAALPPADLAFEVGLSADLPDWTQEWRSDALLTALGHAVEDHGWEMTLVAHGLRVSHAGHAIVLGLPASLWSFVRG